MRISPEDQRPDKHASGVREGTIGREEAVEGVQHHGDHHHVPGHIKLSASS